MNPNDIQKSQEGLMEAAHTHFEDFRQKEEEAKAALVEALYGSADETEEA